MSSKAQIRKKDYERGLRIADRRKEMGLSQDELAHRAGIGRQALSAIENGGDFKTQTLDSLAIVLGVSVDFIMYGENEEKSELLSEAMDVLSDMDDREALNAFFATLKEEDFEVVVVRSLNEITDDIYDLEEFVKTITDMGIWLYSLEVGPVPITVSHAEDFGC